MRIKLTRYLVPLVIVWLGAIMLGLSGCSTAETTDVNESDVTQVQAAPTEGGAQMWAENCMRCHNMRYPPSYSDAEWEVAAHHMRVRANLTGKEHRAIVAFLKSANN